MTIQSVNNVTSHITLIVKRIKLLTWLNIQMVVIWTLMRMLMKN